jgi:hypothetical protein
MKLKSAALALCASAVCLGPSHAEDGLTVPPSESVGGRSQAEWSRAWWQWAGSFEQGESPVADRTGRLCGSKQGDNVWFLAGTYGTERTFRKCRVPRGRYLFFPLINYVVMPPASRPVNCMAVTREAASITDDVSALVLDVDGVRVPDLVAYRQASAGCFDMGERAEPKVRVFPSAANGYYVMLRPLSPGTHLLNFGGALPGMVQAVTYRLVVE